MNGNFLRMMEEINRVAKNGELKMNTNVHFVGQEKKQQEPENKQEDSHPLHDIFEELNQLFEDDGEKEINVIPPQELDETLKEFDKRHADKIQHLAGGIFKYIEDNPELNIPTDMINASNMLTKMVQHNVMHLMDQLDIMDTPEMLQFMMTPSEGPVETIHKISELMDAHTREEKNSAIPQFLLLIMEQLTSLQITFAFLDKFKTQLKEERDTHNE